MGPDSGEFGIRLKAFRSVKKTVHHPVPYEYEGTFRLCDDLKKYENTLNLLDFLSKTLRFIEQNWCFPILWASRGAR